MESKEVSLSQIGPKIVCLCGSTKFKEEFEKVNMKETLNGNIVLSVGCFDHHDKINIGEKQKNELAVLHNKKIDMADEVFVLNVKGYIGESTSNEIKYAKEIGKPIRYLEDPEWYGDGTEEDIGEVDINDEELQDFFKAIYKVFDKDKLSSNLIKKLGKTISENNERSVKIVNILLKKLTEVAEKQHNKFDVYSSSSWTSYFDTKDIRTISDFISDMTFSLSQEV